MSRTSAAPNHRKSRTLHFVLRYSDALRGADTLDEHKRIAEKHGSVWWGKFGLGSSPAIIAKANAQIRSGEPTYVYLLNGSWVQQVARLQELRGGGANTRIAAPAPSKVPAYYRREDCSLWFRLADFKQPTQQQLGNLSLYNDPGVAPRFTSARGLIYVCAERPFIT